MVKRRIIGARSLQPSLYFNDKGHERGIAAENIRDFERYINKQHKTQKRPITVYIIPTTRDKLISGVPRVGRHCSGQPDGHRGPPQAG